MHCEEAKGDVVKTVYVTIGNSDDKLTQSEWACFQIDVHKDLMTATREFHGSWHSNPGAPWQNAAWCIVIPDGVDQALKARLRVTASNYRQDSIAWAEVPNVEFLKGNQ